MEGFDGIFAPLDSDDRGDDEQQAGRDYLLPCPRCGSDAHMFPYDDREWRICCDSDWRICDFCIGSTDRNILVPWWNSLAR